MGRLDKGEQPEDVVLDRCASKSGPVSDQMQVQGIERMRAGGTVCQEPDRFWWAELPNETLRIRRSPVLRFA